jgi:hypothetical protein
MIRRAALPALLIFVMFFGFLSTGACFAQDTARLTVIRNIPIVKGTINGITAYFIVDTGSTITVLNESLRNDYGFSVIKNHFWNRRLIIGMGGRAFLKQVNDVTIGLGNMHLEFVNKSADLTLLSEQFATHGITIAGIIGTDLLCFLHSQIDLHDKVIVFKTDTRPVVNATAFVND